MGHQRCQDLVQDSHGLFRINFDGSIEVRALEKREDAAKVLQIARDIKVFR